MGAWGLKGEPDGQDFAIEPLQIDHRHTNLNRAVSEVDAVRECPFYTWKYGG